MALLKTFLNELKAEQALKQQAIRKQNARYTGLNNRNRHNHSQRKQLDPIAFYSRFGISLKSGKEWQLVKCAFHDDKKPSMSVNIKHGGYHCFACGAKGSMIDFYMHQKHVDFKTACRELNI